MNASATTSICFPGRLMEVCRSLGWTNDMAGMVEQSRWVSSSVVDGPCLLRWLVASGALKRDFQLKLEKHIERGLTLRQFWPHGDRLTSNPSSLSAMHRWLGPRWLFGHSATFDSFSSLCSIVSSRLGRDLCRLPAWPHIVDSLLRDMLHRGSRLLLVHKTTLESPLSELASMMQLATVQLETPHPRQFCEDWLASMLDVDLDRRTDKLFLGPPYDADPRHALEPLRDRAAFYLADRVYCLAIRAGGVIDQLATQRLSDAGFVPGSLFVVAEDRPDKSDAQSIATWLRRGAVGWYISDLRTKTLTASLPQQLAEKCRLSRCASRRPLPTWQLTSPLPRHWSSANIDQWKLLTHCTRANPGPVPGQSDEDYWRRQWLLGAAEISHPLLSLDRICHEGRIRGSSRVSRANVNSVSFSEVPLPQLLEQRCFRSHLGRWDWEPHGVLVERSALIELGARPVIYGQDEDFEQLLPECKPYFQAAGKSADWTAEREWRILGDVDLHRLPQASVCLFTYTQQQARQLSSRYAWPVFWVEL